MTEEMSTKINQALRLLKEAKVILLDVSDEMAHDSVFDGLEVKQRVVLSYKYTQSAVVNLSKPVK